MSLNTTCWPGPPKGPFAKSQLSTFCWEFLVSRFFFKFFLGLADRGSRISIWIMVEPRVESPEQNWSYPGAPLRNTGCCCRGPLFRETSDFDSFRYCEAPVRPVIQLFFQFLHAEKWFGVQSLLPDNASTLARETQDTLIM